MNNYYRITAYYPDKDLSVIMDCCGMFEKNGSLALTSSIKALKYCIYTEKTSFSTAISRNPNP